MSDICIHLPGRDPIYLDESESGDADVLADQYMGALKGDQPLNLKTDHERLLVVLPSVEWFLVEEVGNPSLSAL